MVLLIDGQNGPFGGCFATLRKRLAGRCSPASCSEYPCAREVLVPAERGCCLSVEEKRHAGCHAPDERNVVRGEDDRGSASACLLEPCCDQIGRRSVKTLGGLVEKQERRLCDQQLLEREQLLLTSGKIVGWLPPLSGQPDAVERMRPRAQCSRRTMTTRRAPPPRTRVRAAPWGSGGDTPGFWRGRSCACRGGACMPAMSRGPRLAAPVSAHEGTHLSP